MDTYNFFQHLIVSMRLRPFIVRSIVHHPASESMAVSHVGFVQIPLALRSTETFPNFRVLFARLPVCVRVPLTKLLKSVLAHAVLFCIVCSSGSDESRYKISLVLYFGTYEMFLLILCIFSE